MPGTFRLLVAALALVPLAEVDEPFRPEGDRHGILDLPADRATLVGDRLRLSVEPSMIVDWDSTSDAVRWDFELDAPGRFVVVVEYAAPAGRGGAIVEVEADDQVRRAPVHATGGEARFFPQPLKGAIELPAGTNRLDVRAVEVPGGMVMNLKRVRLVPATK